MRRAGAPLRRHQVGQERPALQVAPRRHRRRRPAPRLHLCRRRRARRDVAARLGQCQRHLQRRHRPGPQLPRSHPGGLCRARRQPQDRLHRHARRDPQQLSIFHAKPRSNGCTAPATMAASPRSRTPCRPTSKISSIAPIAIARSHHQDRDAQKMFDFDLLAKAIVRQTVLCVGDLMLDEFVYGEVSRISPEAPAPVLAVRRTETKIGGAGNVARNIAALGARCIFVSLTGDDMAGRFLKEELSADPLIEPLLVVDRRPADDAQDALRVRAFLDASVAGRCRAGRACIGAGGATAHQRRRGGTAPRRRRAAVGLCQGRADRPRGAPRHRRGAPARQARHRRSQERQSGVLSRRHFADAEPQGVFGSHAPAHPLRRGHRGRFDRGAAHGGCRSRAGDAQRGRHDARPSRWPA